MSSHKTMWGNVTCPDCRLLQSANSIKWRMCAILSSTPSICSNAEHASLRLPWLSMRHPSLTDVEQLSIGSEVLKRHVLEHQVPPFPLSRATRATMRPLFLMSRANSRKSGGLFWVDSAIAVSLPCYAVRTIPLLSIFAKGKLGRGSQGTTLPADRSHGRGMKDR